MKSRLIPCMIILAGAFCSTTAVASDGRISDEGRRAFSPEVAIGPDGAINVIWFDKGLTADRPPPKPRKPGEHSHLSRADLYFSRSEDGGDNWSTPLRISSEAGETWGFSVSKPQIAVGPGGTIHVFYPANDVRQDTNQHIVSARYRRSTDNGRSFSDAVTINSPPTVDQSSVLGEGLSFTNSFGTMGVAADGSVVTAWQNIANMQGHAGGADGVVAVSRNDGKSFEAERVALPGADVCPCCQLTLGFGDDTTYLGYRKIYDDGRDSTVAKSTDGARTFSTGGRLDLDPWPIDGCPLKPTVLAVDADNVYAVVYTGGEQPPGLYFTVSRDGGETFAGKQQVHPEAVYADAPAMTVDPAGVVRLVWHAKTDGPRRLFTAVSLDGGRTLSASTEVATPAGTSMLPASAVDAAGNVYVVWQQENEEVWFTRLAAPASATQQ